MGTYVDMEGMQSSTLYNLGSGLNWESWSCGTGTRTPSPPRTCWRSQQRTLRLEIPMDLNLKCAISVDSESKDNNRH